MKSKEEIVNNWLPRYTGEELKNFGKYILLTNFSNYVNLFARWHKVKLKGSDKPFQCATANGITIINFGMGSPGAATVMEAARVLCQRQRQSTLVFCCFGGEEAGIEGSKYFVDHFPGYMYYLLGIGEIYGLLTGQNSLSYGFEIFYKLVTSLFDFGSAYFIYLILKPKSEKTP